MQSLLGACMRFRCLQHALMDPIGSFIPFELSVCRLIDHMACNVCFANRIDFEFTQE